MVLWEKLCCWKLYKHMISYNFLYLFLNQRTYMFSLMHTDNTTNIQCKPVSVWFLHIWPILLREMGPRFTGHRSLKVTWFLFPKMANTASKNLFIILLGADPVLKK